MTANERETLAEVISELANVLQSLTDLSTRLRRALGDSAQDAVVLEGQIDRCVRALKRLQPRAE